MSFYITVAKPLTGDKFTESIQDLKDCDMWFVPEFKVWIGEICADAYSDCFRILGEFVWDSGHAHSLGCDGALNSSLEGPARDYLLEEIRLAVEPWELK